MNELIQKRFDFYICSGKLGKGKRVHLYKEYKKDFINHRIGKNIKEARTEKRMSKKNLGFSLNRTPNYIDHLEKGNLNISMFHLMKLTILFDKSLRWFIRGIDYNDYIL
ncbi:MAG: helix-turn-helix domain-containing protein [Anaerolineaceae bacterium]|nr:helix-turn-helix domain-containing protein [Anaerolineaceae bacterium]